MAINDITLTAGMRSTLTNLQETAKLFDRTQTRLASGKKVNSALDDPINYFAAKSYMDTASDLNALKDSMNEGIQSIKTADAGITSLTELVSQAKSVAVSALSTSSTTERSTLAAQFNSIRTQMDQLAGDAIYNGTNLLGTSNTLIVRFSASNQTNSLTITGLSATSGGNLALSTAAGNWATDANITAAQAQLDTANTTLRTGGKTLASNLSIIQTRLNFTTSMVNVLTKGAENLTLADMNEEGANLLMLQTRQSLSATSLSLASQAAQSVLRLF